MCLLQSYQIPECKSHFTVRMGSLETRLGLDSRDALKAHFSALVLVLVLNADLLVLVLRKMSNLTPVHSLCTFRKDNVSRATAHGSYDRALALGSQSPTSSTMA